MRHSCVVTVMVTFFGGMQGDLQGGWMFGQEKMMVGDMRWQKGGVGYNYCVQCQVISKLGQLMLLNIFL